MNRSALVQQSMQARAMNPGSLGGQLPVTMMNQPKSRGNFLTNLAGNIFDPFLDVAEGGRYLLSGNKKNYKPMFMDQQEFDKYRGDFLGEALKTGLGLGSFFVPGGSLAKAGLAGAMSGLSQVDDWSNMGDVLKQAGLGAVGGGATYGALKGITKILPKGANKAVSAIGKDTPLDEGLTKQILNAVNPKSIQGQLLAKKAAQKGLTELDRVQAITSGLIPDNGAFSKIANAGDDYLKSQVAQKVKIGDGTKTGIAGALEDLANKTEIKGYVKKLGASPTPTQGGNSLFNQMKEIGIDPSKYNLNSLQDEAGKIVSTTGKQLGAGYKQMAQSGVKIDVQDILQKYADDIANTPNPTLKKAKDKALNELMGTIENISKGNANPFELDPVQFQKVKSQIGKLGDFDPKVTPISEARSLEHLNNMYFDLSDKLTEVAKSNGFNDVANLNKAFSVASKTKNYAKYANTKLNSKSPMGLIDYGAAGTGLLLSGGNPLAAGGMVVASKAAQSPTAHFITANALRGASKLTGKLPNIVMNPQIANALERSAGRVGGTMASMPAPAMAAEPDVMGASTGADQLQNFIQQNGYAAEDFNNPSAQQALFENFGGQVSPQQAFSTADQMGLHELFQPEGMRQPQIDPLTELKLGLLGTGMSPNDMQTMLETFGIGGSASAGKQLPPTTLMKISDAQNALDAISGLEGLLNNDPGKFNPITGMLAEKNPFDTKGQAMNAQLRTARQKIGKFLEGGVLRREDEIKYKEMLPGLTDTADVAAAKIMQVKAMLENEYGNLMNQLQAGGYDPTYGGSGNDATAYEDALSLAGLY